jgi:hypothetical protein
MTANNETAAIYLFDLGTLLLEQAGEARAAARADPSDGFMLGRLSAYHEVLALMVDQARAFDPPLERLGLSGVDPDRDFLR